MFKKVTQIIISTFLFLGAALSALAYSKASPIDPITPGITSIPQFIKSLTDIMMKVGIPVGTLAILWSGFMFIKAQGNPGEIQKAKDSFFWSCIGILILLGSWLIANAIVGTITLIGGPANPGNLN